ncbi:MAG: hypothetical protein ACI3XR_02880 [Eubacteriales bacterium]
MANNKLILGSGDIEGDFHNITAAGALEARNGSARKIRVAGAAELTRFRVESLAAAGAVDCDSAEIVEGKIAGAANMKGICTGDTLELVGSLSAESLHCRHLIFSFPSVHVQVDSSGEQSTASGTLFGDLLESGRPLYLSADCKFDSYAVSGELESDREISCERFYGFGKVVLPAVNADSIFLLTGFGGAVDEIGGAKLTVSHSFTADSDFRKLKCRISHPKEGKDGKILRIDRISCDEVRLEGVHCRLVECGYAEIAADCEIGELICGRDSKIAEGACIGKISYTDDDRLS